MKTTGCKVLIIKTDRHKKLGGKINSVERKGILQIFLVVLYKTFYDELHFELQFHIKEDKLVLETYF